MMMTTNHTPGPWKINADCPMAKHGQISIETDDYYIALLDAGARQTANARLIAAAPELLEALQACNEAMSYMSEYDIPLTLPAQVKAAIAKATGVTPCQ